LALCSLPFAVARGQGTSATLSGTVVDQNGAVVLGADVKITNPATAFSRETKTNDSGDYTFPLLPPGTYQVTAQRDGFSPVRVENVVLNVGDQKALNISLKAGDVNATVTVDSNAETIRTDGSVGTVINRQFVANIPLNGRSLQALIQLVPGVVLTPAQGAGATDSTQFSVNGQRTASNYYTVDGAGANTGIVTGVATLPRVAGAGAAPGTTALGGTNSLVSLDALQEFRIETSSYAAEYGRTPGGQISLVTRSGTNQFHGSAYEYFRNEALDANDWFANANKQPKPKERQNFFGGVLGGPIKRDRLFFFGSYEGLRLQQPNVQVVNVPTVALRTQAAAALRPYLNAFPLPNGQDFGNGTAQFIASYSDPASFNVFALRLDGRLTDKLTGFFRINHAPSESKTRGSALSTISDVRAENDSYTGGITWVAGPNITADVRLNWTRNAPQLDRNLDAFGGAVIPNASDIFLPGRDPSNAFFFFSAPGGPQWNWGRGLQDVQRQFNAVATLAWLVGPHQLKLGVDYRRLSPLLGQGGQRFENLIFATTKQVLSSQALVYQLTDADIKPREPIFDNLSVFAQDTWRASRRLTLTYGLRFERVPPPSEVNGRSPAVLLGIEDVIPQNPRLAPAGTPLWHSRFGDFAPRFGIAYQISRRPGWETTLRGGAGVFYDLGLGSIASAFQGLYPFFAVKVTFNVPFPLGPPANTPPRLVLDPPAQLYALEPNLRLPYTGEWNASFQQSIGDAQSVTVGYVGAAGRRLLVQQINRAALADFPANVISLVIQRNLGSSSYNALQVQYQRRLKQGFQAIASYSFAKSTDNTSVNDSDTPAASFLEQNFGPSDFDVRHVFSTALTYELPRPSGPAPLRVLAKDWGVDVMFRYQSALPITPIANLAVINGVRFFPRADLVPGQPLYIDDQNAPGGRRFNLDAVAAPPSGQQGNFPRNGLRGLPASQVDLALRREFKLREYVRLQLRGELFNVFNHPNFGLPASSITDGNFGKPTSMMNRAFGGLNALYQMGGPRSGQLVVRVTF